MPKRYPAEFRDRALSSVVDGRTVVSVAHDLGISPNTLDKWRDRARIDAGLKAGVTSVEAAELRSAGRRIRELEGEVTIVQRAAVEVKEVVLP